MRTYPEIAIQIGEILLPSPKIDLQKWAVIACDQFTSEPEYWQQVAELVGDAPSTFNLILPEVYLGAPDESARVATTQAAMHDYLSNGIFVSHSGLILVERSVNGRTRHGLMLSLDLEQYDFHRGSQTLIRATEGTILERLPPRIRIRQGAPLELPHILVLIDDPDQSVIAPLVGEKDRLECLYDTDLMLGSGHLRGYAVSSSQDEQRVVNALRRLADPLTFRARYGVGPESQVLLFAMGDGNHSLATAKAIWENLKPQVGMDHPARYALVEIENVHDAGLEFEPIHRVLFNVNQDLLAAMRQFYGSPVQLGPVASMNAMMAAVIGHAGPGQAVGLVSPDGFGVLLIPAVSNLPVGSLQIFLDDWLAKGGAGRIDYVHGDDVVSRLGGQPGNLGFFLPAMAKSELFKTVILDGALPRKTFSMGEAREKRFYLEARRITI